MLALDLGVFQRNPHSVTMREALIRCACWISLGLGFGIFVHFAYDLQWFGLGVDVDSVDGFVNDGDMALAKYLTGYLVEQSLSADNVVVMVAVFAFFGVAPQYQHRVLFWGIIGAIVMRGVMIAIGATLISRFHWILYVFGGFPDPHRNPHVLRQARARRPRTESGDAAGAPLHSGDGAVPRRPLRGARGQRRCAGTARCRARIAKPTPWWRKRRPVRCCSRRSVSRWWSSK